MYYPSKIEIEKKLEDIPNQILLEQKYTYKDDAAKIFPESSEMVLHGTGKLENYSIYPGIDLSFFCLLTDRAVLQHDAIDSVIEINYCRQGRIGWEMKDKRVLYLGPGDFSIHTLSLCSDSAISLPLGYYEGIVVCIDTQILKLEQPEALYGTPITGDFLYQKFCANGDLSIFPGSEHTNTLFNGLFDLPESLRLAYFKLKVQELLLYLYSLSPSTKGNPTQYQADQIHTIKLIHNELVDNLDKRITIDELAKKYLMNSSTLKSVFKAVYGSSIAAHTKEHRMEKAAVLLRESEKSISQIAKMVGYESQSKFTIAFQDFFGVLPKEYRKAHVAISKKSVLNQVNNATEK